MTMFEKRATDGGTLQLRTTYVYDVFNRRVEEQTWDGSTTTTLRNVYLDRGTAIIELDGNNAVQTRYVHQGQRALEAV